MAKKVTKKPDESVSRPETWSPDRSMGLARALNKAGFGSRPQTTKMVKDGCITVDGEIVVDPLFPVTPDSKILLDGKELVQDRKSYFAFHKPMRVVIGSGEISGRKQIDEFFPSYITGLQAVGRLDGRTTGLMLVSNDTAWNNRAASELKLEQEVRVQVEGELGDMELSVISASIHLPGMGIFRPLSVKIVETLNGRTVMNIVVKEGKIRQIRKMFATLRHKILLMRRIRIGEIWLGDLAVGGCRPLTEKELSFIRKHQVTASSRKNQKA